MPGYRITKNEYGDGYTATEVSDDDSNGQICCIGCIGLVLLSVIAYVIILICGSDPTGDVLSWLTLPFVLVLEFVHTNLSWIPVDWIPIANISPLF